MSAVPWPPMATCCSHVGHSRPSICSPQAAPLRCLTSQQGQIKPGAFLACQNNDVSKRKRDKVCQARPRQRQQRLMPTCHVVICHQLTALRPHHMYVGTHRQQNLEPKLANRASRFRRKKIPPCILGLSAFDFLNPLTSRRHRVQKKTSWPCAGPPAAHSHLLG
ncbi:hypothetical protein M441DRAFT_366032 [Trichoderma asperellum CBS 433.97]|uniref:Uncharacterized protein n=1 Tax=Trichoderma asperellum (strain ATCC 204424 / CBS 433.97 / NBRC 101777) TaxID=1042311 RepID=A0A2T3ZE72_TRIA4|nr:hypothetical protein M441DRAFT_366032 [Trichoderma asperellum CBS 433.97]PTB43107.1 hypothetical protein M441DRAFT_366032 [Trichoderma asperellum CBS 433.97]